MSDSYETRPGGTDVGSSDTSGKVDATKQAAADLKDTATTQVKDVLGTAKYEAATVVGEAKVQAKDLFAQTQTELKDQAGAQQQRLAVGLRSLGDELGSMAANAEGSGVASDLVKQVSTRLSNAGAWLSDRDPGSVLEEVKRFARRRPGTFIIGAAVAGILVGRLTRALTANASDDSTPAGTPGTGKLPPVPAPQLITPDKRTATPVGDGQGAGSVMTHNSAADSVAGAPLYAQTAPSRPDILGEDGDERPDAV